MQAIIIASNPEEREFLSYVLRHAGLAVARTSAVKMITSSLIAHTVDLILAAPARDGRLLEDLTAIRAMSHAPLLLLTDPLTEDQYCEAMDAGVDLVLERPLSPRILTRYVRMFLYRNGALPSSMLSPIMAEGISLDPATRTVSVTGHEAQQLTPLEFRLLYTLMTNAEQVITLDVIIERVWGYSGEGSRELVRGLVRRLRRKIEPDSNKPYFIHNHPGIGYRFAPHTT